MLCCSCSKYTTLQCGVCGRASFCSIECQRRLWKIHRLQCSTIPSKFSIRQPDLLKSELEQSLFVNSQHPIMLKAAAKGLSAGLDRTGFQLQELYEDQLKILASKDETRRQTHLVQLRNEIYKYAPEQGRRKIWKEKPIYPYYELARIETELGGHKHNVEVMKPILDQYFTFFCLQDQLPGDLHLSVHTTLYDSAYRRLELLLQETDFIKFRICECGYDIVLKQATRAANFYKGVEEARNIVQKQEFKNGKAIVKMPLAVKDGMTMESLYARVGDDKFKEI